MKLNEAAITITILALLTPVLIFAKRFRKNNRSSQYIKDYDDQYPWGIGA